MALSSVLALVIAIARAFGLASDEVVAYAKQLRPELRTEPLPDAAGDMYAAREVALAVPDSPAAAEVYDGRAWPRIIVNGIEHDIATRTLTYDQILVLAGYRPKETISVVWRHDGSGATVTRGEAVTVHEGMRITAIRTGAA